MSIQPHIRCSEEHGAVYAILPGDPMRVDRVAEFLDDVEWIAFNREHKSIRGTYKGIPVLSVSTGMGGASTGIAVEELKAIGVQYMIRIGSCGALQSHLQMGDLVFYNGAVRDDGASKAYVRSIFPAIPDTDVLSALITAAKQLTVPYHVGIGRSSDSFYTDNEEEIRRYWAQKGVLASDMEAAALFTIGSLRGIKTGAVLNTVALYGGDIKEEINHYVDGAEQVARGERDEIRTALEAIYLLAQQAKESRDDEKQ
ncbi:nucleoside phosphorylase [Streptococcus sp. DD13]|uniref:nucleoside phosphorylase n=1 Tax=Streptococcus sp. DD13 TaxID=1777881 RepID=UPI0009ED5D3F|nr:nucleoside phosphorylase [Streptococcus sp. DD13]